ncbi:MAG: endonuclease [Fidelibacterota bacterium]
MRITRYGIIFLVLLGALVAQIDETIGPGLIGDELLNFVVDHYKTTTTLGYGPARDILYGTIDIHDGNLLTGVYSGFTITMDTTADPSSDAYAKGINCEHTWPQSMGAGQEPQKSDMHHLFPTRIEVNSARGSDPFLDIVDTDTDHWYRLDMEQSSIPAFYLDEWSEKDNDGQPAFEVREDHKGNTARAMFYFFTMYQSVADVNFWNIQKLNLLEWHYLDPVDSLEFDRSWQIATYQENKPNPFILDSTLARRIWWPSPSDTAQPENHTYYVSPDGSDLTGDGSMTQPFAGLQTAINHSIDGDSIIVFPGLYAGGIDYSGKNLVIVSQYVFTGDSAMIDQTVIDANGDGGGVIFSGGEDSTARLTGFTLRNGTGHIADPDGDGNSSDYGGGIYCENANPVLSHLRITQNTSTNGGGGGIFLYNSSPRIQSVVLDSNASGDVGGALYAKHYSSPVISDSRFIANTCAVVGGAVYARDYSDLVFSHVVIAQNVSEHAGGGVGFKNNCSPVLDHVTITDNIAAHYGAGLYSNSSTPTVTHSILWANDTTNIYFAAFDNPSTITFFYSDIDSADGQIETSDNGTVVWLDGNFSANPQFCNPDSLDYTLDAASPCAQAGADGEALGALGIGCNPLQVETVSGRLEQFHLDPPYPNPFNRQLVIPVTGSMSGTVTIYNINGRTIRTLAFEPGQSVLKWDGMDNAGHHVSSGIYLVTGPGGPTATYKILFLK